ncbi:hypothetical protein [Thermococcus sp.]|uniref:hypothetical protein n=1 Tax=Thermococcus sp. TaxID=35749 RepID=UPI0025FD60D8|nr:hypothetical protein [Thermococcus sp.]
MRKLGVLIEALSTRFLWLPFFFALPFVVLCPSKALKLVLFGLAVPVSVALHEFLHVVLLPPNGFILRKGTFLTIEVVGNASRETLFLSSILPGIVLGTVGLILLPGYGLVAIPFLLHFLTIPADIAGLGGIKLG